MTEYISEADFGAGSFAIVRDVRGTRVGLRGIERGHQILVMAALTVNPETGAVGAQFGGEADADIPEGKTRMVAMAWSEIICHVLAANGTGFSYAIGDGESREECPFHGRD